MLLVMKHANRYAWGISRAQHLLAQNGNRPAEFHNGANFIKVTVYKPPER